MEFTQALSLDSEYVDAYYYRGRSYRSLDRYEEAIADFEKAIELDPGHADAYYYRGRSYKSLDDSDRARADFETILRLDMDDNLEELARAQLDSLTR